MQEAQLGAQKIRPKTKFDLIEKVGSKGKYQFKLQIIFTGIWCITGMALIGSPFFFMNKKFDCKGNGLLGNDCFGMVCSLPENEWKTFAEKNSDFETIATQFQDYYCSNQVYVDLTNSSLYFGAFVGYILFSFYSDNYGRRIALLVAFSIATIGTIIMVCSFNLPVVALGLFLLGAGADAAINMTFNYLGEVVQNQKRQKYCVLLQPWFAIGACILTTAFYLIRKWRFVTGIFLVIPSVIILFFILIYIEETPQFLLRKSPAVALKALNRIGKINKGINEILDEKDILNVINQQVQIKKFQQLITPIDLCRFPSLRLITICLCIVSFTLYALYYGPVLVIDKIGFNVFVSSYVIQASQLIVYIPLFIFIDKLPRRKSGVVLLSIAGLCACILLFVNKPYECDFCTESIIELIFVSIFRSSSALYFIMVYIYMVELYPTRSRALGGGIASATGTVASTLSPIVLGLFQRKNLNPNIIFAILALLSAGVVTLLPETRGHPLKQQIQQIQMAKEEDRKVGGPIRRSQLTESKQQKQIQSSRDMV